MEVIDVEAPIQVKNEDEGLSPCPIDPSLVLALKENTVSRTGGMTAD